MHQQEVQGTVKNLDASRRMLTLDDGTQLTIPPTVQLPSEIKEGAIVKASFEERSGQNVVTSLEVQQP
jgi:Cu/Ag efflux protein CusF